VRDRMDEVLEVGAPLCYISLGLWRKKEQRITDIRWICKCLNFYRYILLFCSVPRYFILYKSKEDNKLNIK